eukprot:GEMP01025932.1.p1 GENE.GEMP01025932.1~~GEMP01025932.1.p1  ORF type:complete len:162 (+),score=38.24 GEMP01025932.1:579-1064(+)
MTSWFDIDAIPVEKGGGMGDREDIRASAKDIHSMIDKLEKEKGIPPEKVIVGGFSQGALLAMHAALTYPRKVAGAVSFSGWLSDFDVHESNAQTPVLWIHGTLDPVVPFSLHKSGIAMLKSKGVVTETASFPMEHQTEGPNQMKMLVNFLKSNLGPECTSA